MAEKKTNEILEEQRRARQEFLELKKMQSGEMKAPPKPSEVAIVPKTPKEKWDNFWFQYKWYVVAIVATVAVLTVLIAQCATKTKYDLQVVYFTYTTALDEQTEGIADVVAAVGFKKSEVLRPAFSAVEAHHCHNSVRLFPSAVGAKKRA